MDSRKGRYELMKVAPGVSHPCKCLICGSLARGSRPLLGADGYLRRVCRRCLRIYWRGDLAGGQALVRAAIVKDKAP